MDLPRQKKAHGLSNLLRSGSAFLLLAWLFMALLATNLVQLLSLTVWPFSQRMFRKWNRACAQFWWGLCVVTFRFIYGMRIYFEGDILPQKENALVFANHQQMPDILALMFLGWRQKRLGDMKWFVKYALKHVPGLGWGMQFLGCLFVRRNWEVDSARIRSVFSRLLDLNLPFWVITFAEGTRITEAKIERSQNFARKNKLPLLEQVLVPRPRGFIASVEMLRSRLDSVYDVTIGYPQGIPTLWQLLQGLVREIRVSVKRFPIQTLPQSADELSDWLIERFVIKEAAMRDFRLRGAF